MPKGQIQHSCFFKSKIRPFILLVWIVISPKVTNAINKKMAPRITPSEWLLTGYRFHYSHWSWTVIIRVRIETVVKNNQRVERIRSVMTSEWLVITGKAITGQQPFWRRDAWVDFLVSSICYPLGGITIHTSNINGLILDVKKHECWRWWNMTILQINQYSL